MLKLISDHLKTKRSAKNAVKRLPFIIMYVSDRYKTQEICHRIILENGGMLRLNPDFYKNEKMYNKVVDTYQKRANFNAYKQ